MGPLLVSALVGVGVKIATEVVASWFKGDAKAAGESFSATLDQARKTSPAAGAGRVTGAGAAVPATPAASPGVAANRSQVLALEAGAALPGAARTLGVAAYRTVENQAP